MSLLSNFILPFPYEAFTMSNRALYGNIDDYKNMIYKWVHDNTLTGFHKKYMDIAFKIVQIDPDVKEYILNNIDKFRYMDDFSGITFGLRFFEELESMQYVLPYHIEDYDKPLYPGFDEAEFKNMNDVSKLEWLCTNCEFVPFRVFHENLNDGRSHKFSHIKRDQSMMKNLKDYLDKCRFNPNPDKYYFIKRDKDGKYYLKRDTQKLARL